MPDRPAKLPASPLAMGALVCAWFGYFSRGVLGVHFAPDDMMNADSFYWTPGPWRLVYAQFLIWRGYYRPMGGLFYFPLASLWGLNPVPYHLVLSGVLLVNVWLVYRLARRLGAENWIAGLAALAAAYHAGLGNLYYNTAFIYDALCGCFYCAALVWYGSIRRRAAQPGARQWLVFAALCLCALNSKEMALTLPGVLAVYEWTYHRPLKAAHLTGVLIAGALTLADLYGKIFGVDALTGMEGYRPVFTWQRFLDFQKILVHDAAFLPPTGGAVLLFWLAISYLAWRPGARPVLRFCWLFLALTPLPIEFLPAKSQACLYIPAIGLAVFAAVVCGDLAAALGAALAREPIFRSLGRTAVTAGLVAVAIFYWGRENRSRQRELVEPVMAALGAQTWQVIEQFRALQPHVRPHSHVVFLSDPFTAWDMLFIADLWFRDRTVTVNLQRLTPLPAPAIGAADALFDYRDGKLVRVR